MEKIAREVKIALETVQFADGEKSVSENKYCGKLFLKDDTIRIFYREEDEDKTQCSITVFDNSVTIVRKSDTAASKMVFEKNKPYKTIYRTQFGNMDLVVNPKKVFCSVASEGGEILLEYDLSLAGESFFNKVTINVESND